MRGAPVLVACGHGTRDAAGRGALARLRLDVAALRPGLDVLSASVDVQQPSLERALARLAAARRPAVVVPLLLSAGYHVYVDVARAVAAHGDRAVATDALGPDAVLVDLLADRLAATGTAGAAAVVLAAAGSSDARAVADVEAVATALQERRTGPVHAAYLSAADPRVPDAVAALGGQATVSVATYLLAPGVFSRRLADAAARVSAPLAPDPRLAALVLRRYDAALG